MASTRLARLLTACLICASPARAEAPPAVTDRHGDPLPPGAVARLGELRFGCGSPIACLAVSPDGRLLATGHGDKTARLWDRATGKELRRLVGHIEPVHGVAFAPDGKTLATRAGNLQTADTAIRLWDVATGRELRRIGEAPGPVRTNGFADWISWAFAVAFSPDGKTLAAGPGVPSGEDHALYLWDVAGGREVRRLEGHTGPVRCFAFAPDGRLLASGGADKVVRLWDVTTGKEVRHMGGHLDLIHGVAFAPDGRTLASVAFDGVRLWDVATGEQREHIHALQARAVAFSPDGRYLAWGHRQIQVRDLRAGRDLPAGRLDYAYGVRSLAFTPDGGTLAAVGVGYGFHVHLWDAATGRPAVPLPAGHRQGIASVAFTPDGRAVASTGSDGLRLWEARTGKEILHVEAGGRDTLHGVQFAPDGRTLIVAEGVRALRVVDVGTRQEIRRLQIREGNLAGVTYAPDGRTLAGAWHCYDHATKRWQGNVILWDLATGRETRPFVPVDDVVQCVAYAPGGRLLAAGGSQCPIHLWDTATAKLVRRLPADSAGAMTMAFAPTGKVLVAGVNGLRRWDVTTGRELPRSTTTVWSHCLAVAPDGRTVAAAGVLGAIHLVELATGRERRLLRGHDPFATCVAYSPDGRLLASGGADALGLVWDVYGLSADEWPAGGPASRPAMEAAWADLAGTDAARADQAIRTLFAAGRPGVTFLKGRLLPTAAPVDEKRIARLIAELDDDDFTVREKASRELAVLGKAAEPALAKALEGNPSPEARRRLEILLDKQRPADTDPGLRGSRAVEALEHLATPDARELLAAVARRGPDAAAREEAKAALARLTRRPRTSP